MKRNQFRGLPVIMSGIPAFIAASDIPSASWTKSHGKTIAGVPVNSAEHAAVGESTVIRSPKGHTLALNNDDAEVLVVDLARKFGYTVTAPAAQQQ